MSMNGKQWNDPVQVERDMIFAVLNVMDHLEAYIDGVMTAAGQHAVPPLGLELLDDVRADLHVAVCPTCAAERAGGAEGKIQHLSVVGKVADKKPDGDQSA